MQVVELDDAHGAHGRMRLARDARGACQDRQEVRGRVLEVVDLARHQRRLRGLRVRHPAELDAVDLHHLRSEEGCVGQECGSRRIFQWSLVYSKTITKILTNIITL